MKKTIISIIIWLFFIIGYGMNLIKFIRCDFEAPYKTEIIRGLGLSSYGGIIGWFTIGEENKE